MLADIHATYQTLSLSMRNISIFPSHIAMHINSGNTARKKTTESDTEGEKSAGELHIVKILSG